MNHPAPHAPNAAPAATFRRSEPFRIGTRIVYAATEAEAVKLLALREQAEARCAERLAAEAAVKAALVAERKAARKAAREAAAHAEASRQAAQAAFDAEWSALLADEERENAAKAARAYWLTGEGERPALTLATPWDLPGMPRRQITARPRPGFGADGNPVMGQGSRTRPGQGTELAHAYTERSYTPKYDAKATVGL
jgi:hypothetical protein